MFKRKCIATLLLLCILTSFLSGCGAETLEQTKEAGSASFPVPEGDVPPAPIGDELESDVHRVTLYYMGTDGQSLKPVERSITLSEDRFLSEAVAEALLKAPEEEDLLPVAQEGTSLIDIEESQGVVTVNLSIDAHNVEDEKELVALQLAFANTLSSLEGIEYVNLLIGDKNEGILQMPMGTLGRKSGNIAAMWATLQEEEKYFVLTETVQQPIERTITLYYPKAGTNYILPEVRTLQLSDPNYVAAVVREVLKGPEINPITHSTIPQDAEVLAQAPYIEEVTDYGIQVAHISFLPTIYDALEASGCSLWQLSASLTYSICGFVPGIDGIRIDIDEQPVMQLENDTNTFEFWEGVMPRSSFQDAYVQMARLYFAGESGKLVAVDRAMDNISAASVRSLLGELIGGVRDTDAGVRNIVPAGIHDTDILGVRVTGDEIHLNLSSNFYSVAQRLSNQEEQLLVYGIVNTLTELEGIKSVRFYVEGQQVEQFVHSICMLGPLLRNPGYIENDDANMEMRKQEEAT